MDLRFISELFCTGYYDLKDPAYQNEISQRDLIHFKYGQVNESTLTPCQGYAGFTQFWTGFTNAPSNP